MRFEVEHFMDQPVERVFAYIAEPRNRPDWQTSIREFEMLSEGEPRLGMQWRERAVGAPPFTMEITAFELNRLWAERGTSPAAEGGVDVYFHPNGEGTRLKLVIDLELKGWRKVVTPFARLFAPWIIRHDLGLAEELIGRLAAASDSKAR